MITLGSAKSFLWSLWFLRKSSAFSNWFECWPLTVSELVSLCHHPLPVSPSKNCSQHMYFPPPHFCSGCSFFLVNSFFSFLLQAHSVEPQGFSSLSYGSTDTRDNSLLVGRLSVLFVSQLFCALPLPLAYKLPDRSPPCLSYFLLSAEHCRHSENEDH